MKSAMKTARLVAGILHVETPIGIVNIHAGLTDRHGRAVVAVEMIPDNHAGAAKVMLRGAGGRFVQCKHAKGGR